MKSNMKTVHIYISKISVDYPYVPVMAETFVKKAEELIDLDFK